MHLTYVALHEVTRYMCCMVYTERAETAAVSCTWHQPCQRCKYTASVDIQKHAIIIRLVTHVESHASAVSLLESGE